MKTTTNIWGCTDCAKHIANNEPIDRPRLGRTDGEVTPPTGHTCDCCYNPVPATVPMHYTTETRTPDLSPPDPLGDTPDPLAEFDHEPADSPPWLDQVTRQLSHIEDRIQSVDTRIVRTQGSLKAIDERTRRILTKIGD